MLCIVAATTFWFFNALNNNYTASLSFPVSFDYPKDEYVEMSELPSRVQINVSGVGWDLLRTAYWFNEEPVHIPLPEPSETQRIPGNMLNNIISEHLDPIQVNYVIDDTLHINIDHLARKKFFLKVDSTFISLEQNFRIVSSIDLSSDTVWLEGPGLMLDNMSDTIVLSISENDIDDNFSDNVDLVTSSPLIRPDVASVQVDFQVEEFVRETRVIGFEFVNFPIDSSWYALDTLVTIEFLVQESKASEITSSDFKAFIDLSRIVLRDSTIQPIIEVAPAGVIINSITSLRIKVVHE